MSEEATGRQPLPITLIFMVGAIVVGIVLVVLKLFGI